MVSTKKAACLNKVRVKIPSAMWLSATALGESGDAALGESGSEDPMCTIIGESGDEEPEREKKKLDKENLLYIQI